jgi:hypothetical protein
MDAVARGGTSSQSPAPAGSNLTDNEKMLMGLTSSTGTANPWLHDPRLSQE